MNDADSSMAIAAVSEVAASPLAPTGPAAPLHPVFVVGCQRSGSTMLGAMLGAHPEIVCIPEAQFTVELMPSDPGAAIDPADVIDRVVRHWRFRIWEFDLGQRRPARNAIKPSYRAAIEWLVREYAASVGRPRARFWVDQDPGNVRSIWKLSQHFGDAKFIHIVRDGRGVAASMIPLDWGPNEIYTAAHWWQRHLSYAFVAAAALEPGRLLHVRYEDVVQRTEPTMRTIAAFLGIEFAPNMLNTTGLRLPKFTRYQHQLIGAPPQAGRVESWRRTLSHREIEIFEAVVGDLLPLLGYQPVFGSRARLPSSWERHRRILLNQTRKAQNAIQMWLRTRPYRRSSRSRIRNAPHGGSTGEPCASSSGDDSRREASPTRECHESNT